MITGYNTDVEHGGVVYHVQTEDKGLETPIVLSLVYSGGAILAAKRSSYQDLIAAGFEEAALAERLQRQHRLICAAIHAGRVAELRQLSKPQTGRLVMPTVEPGPEPKSEMVAAPPAVPPQPPAVPNINPPPIREATVEAPVAPMKPAPQPLKPIEPPRNRLEVAPVVPVTAPPRESPDPPAAPETTVPAPTVAEVVPPPAAPRKTAPSPFTVYDSRRRSRLGEVVQEAEGLRISLVGRQPDFHGGETIELKAIVTRIADEVEEPLAGAIISVKILGTTFRPVLLALKTDREGQMIISTRIPPFSSGRAAIVVKASAQELSTEARWIVHPGK